MVSMATLFVCGHLMLRLYTWVGDFTNWIENQIPMERNEFGVWEVFTSLAYEGQIYKYHITRANGHQLMKIDPLAVRYEARPGTGAILTEIPEKKWKDGLWLARRKRLSFEERPVNIYEAHAGSWKRNPDGSPFSFAQLKDELIPYLVEMNYTHIEFYALDVSSSWIELGLPAYGLLCFRACLWSP